MPDDTDYVEPSHQEVNILSMRTVSMIPLTHLLLQRPARTHCARLLLSLSEESLMERILFYVLFDGIHFREWKTIHFLE